tara:strand:+ start:814 stop:1131 length:318 start_codon:yes stop_codon:yes gene_type:complete
MKMKPTENYEQLLARFTKRTEQLEGKHFQLADAHEEWVKIDNQLHYLRGCKETIEYLMTGKLPNDGNHVGMKDHRPDFKSVSVDYNKMESMLKRPIRHSNLDALD